MDEVNRGNLPRVFGELYFLLEYRDESIGLMYSPDERFSLPSNLLLIGTMNTADRSVVGRDQALRRRFDFVGMFPDRPPVAGMLRRYLAANYDEEGRHGRAHPSARHKASSRRGRDSSHLLRTDLALRMAVPVMPLGSTCRTRRRARRSTSTGMRGSRRRRTACAPSTRANACRCSGCTSAAW
jgi:hypothetical protein